MFIEKNIKHPEP